MAGPSGRMRRNQPLRVYPTSEGTSSTPTRRDTTIAGVCNPTQGDTMIRPLALLTAFLLLLPGARADEKSDRDGFVPLFNGTDLKGWVHVNDWPGTWSVRDNMIVTTVHPVGFSRTDKMYKNFILEFEWNHRPRKDNREGNSGLFVWADPLPAQGQGSFARGIEVQVLVNLEYKNKKGEITATSHGDLFSIWGARCVPDRPH